MMMRHKRLWSSLALSSWFCPSGESEFELLNRSAAFLVRRGDNNGYAVVGSGHVVNPKRYWRRCYPDEAWLGEVDQLRIRLELWSDDDQQKQKRNQKQKQTPNEKEDDLNALFDDDDSANDNDVLSLTPQSSALLTKFWPMELDAFKFGDEHDCCVASTRSLDAVAEHIGSASDDDGDDVKTMLVSLAVDLHAERNREVLMNDGSLDVCGLTIADSGLPSEVVRVARCGGKLKARSQTQMFVDTANVRLEMGFCGGPVLFGDSDRTLGMIEGIVNEPPPQESSDAAAYGVELLELQRQVAGCASLVPAHILDAMIHEQ
jgi:hypothetical protein